MRAVGFNRSLALDEADCLLDLELPMPEPASREVRVKVSAVSVNPVDVKRRMRAAATAKAQRPIILGFDAVGVVDKVGCEVSLFREGDRVWYAGRIDRNGSNAEYQCVDERIIGRQPHNLSDVEAAAMPLTGITAWEAIFDRLQVESRGTEQTILIIGGAGGAGSMATQLAKRAGLVVISTASRPDSHSWCRQQGADHVANHRDLSASVRGLGFDQVGYILNCADTDGHWQAMCDLIAPEGMICSVVGTEQPVDLLPLMMKSAGFVWEMMSTRPMFGTDSMSQQHVILNCLREMVEQGDLHSTVRETLHGLNAETFKQAHARLETGSMIGKLVVSYDV